METSVVSKSSQRPIVSPDGLHVALITSSKIQIRSTTSLSAFRSINLPDTDGSKYVAFRWAPISETQPWSYQLLLADSESVQVWDLRDAKWTARIDNGTGGTGKIAHADFASRMDEVIVVSEFGSRLAIWSLTDGSVVEVKDPRYPNGRSYAFRPITSAGPVKVLALLSRVGPQDILVLYSPDSRQVLGTVDMPTHDAQGLKWSPDGKWLVVWDSPSYGSKLHIYTADGQLYRVCSIGAPSDEQQLQLGAKCLEWSSKGEYLAIGGHDRRVSLLGPRTFSVTMSLEHTASIDLEEGAVWQEKVSATANRSYSSAPRPAIPPHVSTSDSQSRFGISQLAFNSDGSLLATKDELTPSAVWIWDLQRCKPRAVLLQHSNVKRLAWHPTRPDLLLLYCVHEHAFVYLWSALSESPMVLEAPLSRGNLKLEASWLDTKQDQKPAIIVSDSAEFVILWPDGRELLTEEVSDGECSNDDSLDSVIEMLAGRTPLPNTKDMGREIPGADNELTTSALNDTFRWKKP